MPTKMKSLTVSVGRTINFNFHVERSADWALSSRDGSEHSEFLTNRQLGSRRIVMGGPACLQAVTTHVRIWTCSGIQRGFVSRVIRE